MSGPTFDLIQHLHRQREFSERTFGPGARTAGVIDHIRKELREIEAAPADISEWIDVVLLALDGAWRSGASPVAIAAEIIAKQAKNEARDWPDWRTADPDKAIEHDRSGDATAPVETGEALARQFHEADLAECPADGTLDGLMQAANMLDEWIPLSLPANEQGQVHFARGLAESASATMRAYLAAQPQAREDAQPFMFAYEDVDRPGEWRAFRHQIKRADGSICPGRALYTHPAPDSLRVAVEALEFYRDAWNSEPNGDPRIEGDASGSLTEPADALLDDKGTRASVALAALQAGQKGGA